MTSQITIIGGGLGGMAAAITAAEEGLDVTLVEKGAKFGGAAAFSGGQVWVGGNHVAAREGLEDNLDATLTYVRQAAGRDAASVELELAREWLGGAADAAEYFEALGVIRWELVPDYPDYYYPDLEGSRPAGRYLTGALFDGHSLGSDRDRLLTSPHFPVGVTYAEMFSWGGMSNKPNWDWPLVKRRREQDMLTFGTGIAAAFLQGVVSRKVRLLTGCQADELVTDGDGTVVGVRCVDSDGERIELSGPVILATGAHDWSERLSHEFTGIPSEDGGSVAPVTVSGDAVDLVQPVGGVVAALPAWAAPVLPGYKLSAPAFDGDTGYRACYEHCLPHTFLVNRAGLRFTRKSSPRLSPWTSTDALPTCRSS
jgi:3-oxosteroid 1-dehydrogenase